MSIRIPTLVILAYASGSVITLVPWWASAISLLGITFMSIAVMAREGTDDNL